jgi:predicted membrane GTPase involved in stress response
MNLDLPIEQLVKRVDTRFQLGFAAEAKGRLRDSESFALAGSHLGVHVLARNEDSLAQPVELLRSAYGAALHVGPPTVRLIAGVQVKEPVMHVRISLDTRHQEAVKAALAARGVNLAEAHARRRKAVLRYEAPLARLLGLPAEITTLTAGTARYWIVLSHYALVIGDPGGKAA